MDTKQSYSYTKTIHFYCEMIKHVLLLFLAGSEDEVFFFRETTNMRLGHVKPCSKWADPSANSGISTLETHLT
jgi:hypothetical protein